MEAVEGGRKESSHGDKVPLGESGCEEQRATPPFKKATLVCKKQRESCQDSLDSLSFWHQLMTVCIVQTPTETTAHSIHSGTCIDAFAGSHSLSKKKKKYLSTIFCLLSCHNLTNRIRTTPSLDSRSLSRRGNMPTLEAQPVIW